MNKYVLITAGNTSEPIDSIRSITNMASGKLGSLIADAFYANDDRIVYVCGKNSLQPSLPALQTIVVEGVSELEQTIQKISKEYSFDCIVHSMAVSDYRVKGILPYKELENRIKLGIKPDAKTISGKLSSDISDPVILLEKAPKIIREFKKLQPQALLVGFKLLVGVTEHELYTAAMSLMDKNKCDFVCANDFNKISEEKHEALLIGADGRYKKLAAKKEIANAIVTSITDIWRNTK